MTHPKIAWLEEISSTYDKIRNGDRELVTERTLATCVEKARTHGATWQEVGDAMGVSRQYAHKRFNP